MYGRKTVMSIAGDPSILKIFADGVFNSPMYVTVVDLMKQTPGFEFKSHALVDFKDRTVLMSKIVFTDKDTFDSYDTDPSTVSLWDYLKQLAEEDGITVEMIDGELASDV